VIPDRHGGTLKSRQGAPGFTLLELAVVMLLLSILLGFALPAILGGDLLASRTATARKIAWAVKKLKHDALTRQTPHSLHLDLNAGRIWATRERDPDEKAEAKEAEPWTLPDGMRIESIDFPHGETLQTGEAMIGFYPQGYSDRALIRLRADNGDHTDILIETFLPFARILEGTEGAGWGTRP
jgi:prepilin-type N-terminal cleavage/methylation domain-containing protein